MDTENEYSVFYNEAIVYANNGTKVARLKFTGDGITEISEIDVVSDGEEFMNIARAIAKAIDRNRKAADE
jgi:hypothetical protein